MKFNKICQSCSKEYTCYYEKSKYCSRQCYKNKISLPKKECPVCNKSFVPRWHGQIHCNVKCYSKSEKLREHAKNSILIKGNKFEKWHEGYIKENVGYRALHDWVRYHKVKTGFCEICHSKKSGYTNGKDFELANISGEYLRDLDDFSWLCCKCHRRFDSLARRKLYVIMAVEVKSNGYLDPIERQKCDWLLKNNIFSEILVASKGEKGDIIYTDFTEKYLK